MDMTLLAEYNKTEAERILNVVTGFLYGEDKL